MVDLLDLATCLFLVKEYVKHCILIISKDPDVYGVPYTSQIISELRFETKFQSL